MLAHLDFRNNDIPMPDLSESPEEIPVALSIATSDSGAGAGLQADLLTFAARGVFGTTLFCALTAQNPDSVSAIHTLPEAFIQEQWKQLQGYFPIAAIKTGMLFSREIIEQVSGFFREVENLPKVVDPVMVAASGAVLLREDAIDAMKTLLKAATLATPNLDEMHMLVGWRPASPEQMLRAGKEAVEDFGCAVLVKGGHLQADRIEDVLLLPDGSSHTFSAPHLPGVNTHGSGCTLASAITAELAKGNPLPEAVEAAHAYLQQTLKRPLTVSGERFISHGVR